MGFTAAGFTKLMFTVILLLDKVRFETVRIFDVEFDTTVEVAGGLADKDRSTGYMNNT